MDYSDQLDLLEIFRSMPAYVILRLSPDFPSYYKRTDVDILCYDIDACVDYLAKYNLKRNNVSETQLHLDHFIDGELDFRFDLYEEYISPRYKDEAFRTSSVHSGITLPSDEINNVSKCYEYLTYGKEKYKSYAQLKPILNEYRK